MQKKKTLDASTLNLVLLLLPKKWHKMIWVNNRDCPFSNLLRVGHITSGSYYWVFLAPVKSLLTPPTWKNSTQ